MGNSKSKNKCNNEYNSNMNNIDDSTNSRPKELNTLTDNLYYIFGDKIRNNEDIDKYVNNLMVMASNKKITNKDEIVKKKILMEIDKNRFTRKAESLILGFLFPSSIQSLTVLEMTYIWMSYENANFKHEKIHNFLVKNCNNCGETHEINNCRAYGKRCYMCDNKNHYRRRCPSQHIVNCKQCGDDHFVQECPARLNECNRCDRINHFSWKCQNPKTYCYNCGLKHIPSKFACPDRNTICNICKKRGHVPSKCYKK